MPGWFNHCKLARATLIRSSLLQAFPVTLSIIPLSQSNMEELAVPFTRNCEANMGSKFLVYLSQYRPSNYQRLSSRWLPLKPNCRILQDSIRTVLISRWCVAPIGCTLVWCNDLTRRSQFAASPVLLPTYVMKYDLQIPKPITFALSSERAPKMYKDSSLFTDLFVLTTCAG